MRPSFSAALPEHPIQIEHIKCGAKFDVYTIEWPPQVVMCTNCQTALLLQSHDKPSQRLAYRQVSS